MASPVRLESLDSIMPVGVGGVMMMLGTSRCLSLRTGASSWLLLLLTHILKPERAGRGTHTYTHERDKHQWPLGNCPPLAACPSPPSPPLTTTMSPDNSQERRHCCPHFTDEEAEAQDCYMTCLTLHNSAKTVSFVCFVH